LAQGIGMARAGRGPKGRGCRAAGFTLLELVLGVFLTSLILIGVYNMFGSQEFSQVVVDQMAELNQNLRVAQLWLTRDLRMAGYRMETSNGGIWSVQVTDGGDPADGHNTDSIRMRYADFSVSATLTNPMPNESSVIWVDDATGFSVGDLIVITDRNNTSMVEVTQINLSGPNDMLQHNPASVYNEPGGLGAFPGYGVGAQVFRVEYRGYCIDWTDPDRPLLRRIRFRAGVDPLSEACSCPAPTETNCPVVAEYIEDLQVTNPDGSAPTPNNTAYRVTMTARTAKPLTVMGGIRRKTVTQIVNVRNLP
jgi:type II secretory pathway pseudopilin PulG